MRLKRQIKELERRILDIERALQHTKIGRGRKDAPCDIELTNGIQDWRSPCTLGRDHLGDHLWGPRQPLHYQRTESITRTSPLI